MTQRPWLLRPELVVVLAGISAALHVGKLSPALPALRDALGVSLLQAGILLSMPAIGLRYAGVLLVSRVWGMVPGTLFSLATVLAPDESCDSTTVGWMQQLSAFGQFAGPPLVGWVASMAGDWRWTWMVTGTCAMLGVALATQVAREVRR